MTTLQDINAAANWNIRVTENFRSVSPAGLYGIDPTTTTGLVWGYKGGQFNGNAVADGTVTLTGSTTNYVVAKRSDGSVSVATNTTNWADTTNYMQLFSVVTGTSAVTSSTDMRQAFGATGAGGGGGMTNPMTASGDMIYGGTGGLPTRLAAGTNGQVLTLSGGVPTWGAGSGGFSNPMTAVGDLILGGTSGAAGRLGIGSTGQVLTVSGGTAAWVTPSTGGMTNPMTAVGDIIIGNASGAPGRLAAGSTGQVLTIASGAPVWSTPSGGGGGLTNWTDSLSSSSPNASINVASLTATGSGTHISAAIVPKGVGQILAAVPDATSAGGNARGNYAVDLQLQRSSASQVASGAGAFSVGQNNTASGAYSMAVGQGNTTNGSYDVSLGQSNTTSGGSTAIGDHNTSGQAGAVSLGTTNSASGAAAVAIGKNNTSNGTSSVAVGGYLDTRGINGLVALGASGTNLSKQTQSEIVSLATANNNTLTTDGSGAVSTANQLTMGPWGAIAFEGVIIGTSTAGVTAGFLVQGVIKQGNAPGSAALVGTPTITSLGADSGASGWTITISADTTNGCLKIAASGTSGTVYWQATLKCAFARSQ